MLTPFWLDMAAYRAVADVSIYWFVLGAGVGLAYYDAGREKQLQAADLERSLTDAQLEALRMKLQPHFLFNTLNSIAFLALEKDASAIETMVERLGHLLRASVRGHGRQVVTLAEELRLLDQYLAIEELRFKDRLRVTRRIDPSTARARVPSLFLQPIVENSIKHGFSSRIDASCLEITTKVESDALVVLVEDDGPGLPAGWTLDTHCGRGLKNVLQRLDMLYRDRWSFTLRNRPTGGAIAEVRIPLDAGDRSTVGGQ
jgi:LytS/YehU family sensor histidine kinase